MNCRKCLVVCSTLALVMFGCDRGSKVAGKYLNDKKPQDFTELKQDGGCVVKQGTATLEGKYQVDGKSLTITLNGGDVLKGAVDGGVLTDNEGEHWTRH